MAFESSSLPMFSDYVASGVESATVSLSFQIGSATRSLLRLGAAQQIWQEVYVQLFGL